MVTYTEDIRRENVDMSSDKQCVKNIVTENPRFLGEG